MKPLGARGSCPEEGREPHPGKRSSPAALRQGQKLSETELAQALSVSRAPDPRRPDPAGPAKVWSPLIPHRGRGRGPAVAAGHQGGWPTLAGSAGGAGVGPPACAKLDDAGHRELTAIVEEMARERVGQGNTSGWSGWTSTSTTKSSRSLLTTASMRAWTTIKSQGGGLYLLTQTRRVRGLSRDRGQRARGTAGRSWLRGEPGRAVSAINRHIAGGLPAVCSRTYEAPGGRSREVSRPSRKPDRERV